MCVPRKKSGGSKGDLKAKNKSPGGSTPVTSQTPKTQPLKGAPEKAKSATKDAEKKNTGENILAKPMGNAPLKEEKPKTPLHIKVPPPRVMKAKRPMKEVRSARDPEYKTLELDISEWESVKILKRSEINPDDIVKKDFKDGGAAQLDGKGGEKEAVEAAA